MSGTRVTMLFERTLDDAIATLASSRSAEVPTSPLVILPSTLERDDRVAEAVRRKTGAKRSDIVLPTSGGRNPLRWLPRSASDEWRECPIASPDAALSSVRLPAALAVPRSIVIACDVAKVAERGPFLLDVPSRYVHPLQRLRIIASGDRAALSAEVASVIPFGCALVVSSSANGTALAVTSDWIAAELVALALAETHMPDDRSLTGPWEDPVVQRATELRLGVLFAADIRIEPAGACSSESWATETLAHVQRRLGISTR